MRHPALKRPLGRLGFAAAAAPLLVALAASAALARPGNFKVSSTNGLNVRSGPGSGYRVLGSLPRGAAVKTVAEQGEWRKISYRGRTAWVHARYLKPAGAAGSERPAETAPATSRDGTGGNVVDALEGRPSRKYAGNLDPGSKLNLRSGPGTGNRVVGKIPGGTPLEVLERNGEWAKVRTPDGQTGWVHEDYLTDQPETAAGNGDGSGGRSGGGSSAGPGGSPGSSQPVAENLPRSRAGFVQLPNSGPGFFGYYPASKRWGTPTMVYGIMRAARRWNLSGPRMGVGDISLQNGGDIAGHASHERGVDADFRPQRNDGVEGPVTIHQSAYSRSRTRTMIDLLKAELPETMIGFQDMSIPGMRNWSNHHNHFHIRTSR